MAQTPMSARLQALPTQSGARLDRLSLYLTEGLAATAGTMLSLGIFFYTQHRFGWTFRHNLALATGQGIVYILGALLADRLTQRIGRRPALAGLYILLGAAALPAALHGSAQIVVAVLLGYSFLVAMSWPVLESLVSGQADAHTLSRRLGLYNLVWSGVAALTLAINGTIIERWPAGVFIIPVIAHLLGAALVMLNRRAEEQGPPGGQAAIEPEPALRQQRQLALWLSRIALPATYVVICSLMAMLPSLPLVNQLPPRWSTPLCSVWLLTRWLTFLLLGATIAWHTRPKLLLWSTLAMLGAFLGIVLPPTLGMSMAGALPLMFAAQAALGVALGMIYAGSLYFGMVLSDGSTEHGGYHEALIGLGMVIGPGTAAAAQWIRPGDPMPGIAAVAAVLTATIFAAALAARRSQRL